MQPPTDGMRRRRWLWPLTFAGLACAVVSAALLYQRGAAQRDLAALLAELDATDPQWRLEDLEAGRRVLAPEENSVVLIGRLVAVLKQSGFQSRMNAQDHIYENQPPIQLNEEQLQVLLEVFEGLEDYRHDVLALKDLPHGSFPVAYTEDPARLSTTHVQDCRLLIYALQFDVALHAQQGDIAAALEGCRAMVNTARALADEPHLWSQIVRLVMTRIAVHCLERVLAQGQAPDAELRSVQVLLEREIGDASLTQVLRGARATMDRVHLDMAAGKIDKSKYFDGRLEWSEKLALHVPESLDRNRSAHLRWLTRLVGASRLPPPRQPAALAAIEEERRQLPTLVGLLARGPCKLLEIQRMAQAGLNSTRVALAAERYRLRVGAWPAQATDLVRAGLLDAVPIDPYDGQSLRWRLLAEGAVAYSVGRDEVDNHGHVDLTSNVPGLDLGFRLWHPTARRRPPR
jgi:hypothetical protein